MAEITRVQSGTSPEDVVAVLRREGVVIVEKHFATIVDEVMKDVSIHLAERTLGGGKFFGGASKRIAGLVAKSPAFCEIVVDELLLGSADLVLGPNCASFQLASTAALQVWKGGRLQPIHRDEEIYSPFLTRGLMGPEYLLSVIVAGCDFTEENGATRIIPGSHRWPAGREVTDDEIAQAVMPKGSLLLWMGSTYHGAGINETDDPRTAIICGYILGWLRQEENQYLACPPEIAEGLPPRVQQLLGYQAHTPFLGWVDGRRPDMLLQPARPAD